MRNAMKAVEMAVQRRADIAGLKVKAYGSETRILFVTDEAAENCVEIRLIPAGEGIKAGVFVQGDYPLQDMPHRTGDKGTLEQVDERIALVDPERPDTLAALHAILDVEFRHIGNADAAARRSTYLDRRLEGLFTLAVEDPDLARAAFKLALATTLTHDETTRLFEAFEAVSEVPGIPTRR